MRSSRLAGLTFLGCSMLALAGCDTISGIFDSSDEPKLPGKRVSVLAVEQRLKVDKTLDQASASDYDAIVLPGGQINPDLLRVEPKALKFIKDIFDAKKVVAGTK